MASRGGPAATPQAETAKEAKEQAPEVVRPEPKRAPTEDDVGRALHEYLTSRADLIGKFVRKDSTITAVALVQAAGTAYRREPDKMRDERSWKTVVTALIVAAQFDLEPFGREGWLIPREAKRYDQQVRRKVSLGFHEWSFMPSYQGLVKLALLSGRVKSIRSHVVYENDHCKIQLGANPDVDHQPTWGDRGKPIGVYAVARMTDGSIELEPMPWSEVLKIKSAASDYSEAWKLWEEEMARKCPLKRLTKQLPAGQAFAALVQIDNAMESGRDDDRIAAIESALRDKLALLPEAQRSWHDEAAERAPAQSARASAFAGKVRQASAATFAAAAAQKHEGSAVSTLTLDEAQNPPPNVACSTCATTVRAGGLDVDPKWDVFDGAVLCGRCRGAGDPGDHDDDDAGVDVGNPS